MTFDDFVDMTMGDGKGDEDIPRAVRMAAGDLDVTWDDRRDPHDFEWMKPGLYMEADGTVCVVGSVGGLRGGRMLCCWWGKMNC